MVLVVVAAGGGCGGHIGFAGVPGFHMPKSDRQVRATLGLSYQFQRYVGDTQDYDYI